MQLFDPIRDFFQPRATRRWIEQLPEVRLLISRCESLRGNFVFPGQDCSAWIDHEGMRVGHVDFGMNPLCDRLYINMIRIAPAHTCTGLGMATLWQLWNTYGVPIVPLHEYGSSIGFWAKARQRLAAAGGMVGAELRCSEMREEQQRWQHLVPEPDHLRLQRELMASPEWPQIQAEFKARYGV